MPDERLHPLRGIGATIGGFLTGLGIGLVMGEPAAGSLAGMGLGLVLTSVLRTAPRR